jgi:hypothetical protein
MRRLLTLILLLVCALGATSARATQTAPHVVFGVADDGAKYADDGGGNFFATMRDLGLDSNRITVTWDPTDGNRGLTIREKSFLDRAIPVATLRGIDIVLDVYPLKARAFAVDTNTRITLFAEYLQLLARTYPSVRTFIVGNEPNQPRFNQPQFVKNGRRGYTAVAGALYEQVLAAGYDALKAIDPRITVVGLGLSPRGNDDPRAKNNISRSPVRFLHDLAAAYRASGRDRPLMDELGFHPYPNSNNDPVTRGYSWPNAGFLNLDRIKQAIWDGFAGSPQPVFAEPPSFGLPPDTAPSLKLELDEYGRQATVISSEVSQYTGRENVHTVSEATQAAMYGWVVRQAACDPDVSGFFLFHLIDEPDLDRFQSGLLRVDGSKRPSYSTVKDTLASTHGQCVGAVDVWRHATSVIGADVTFEDAALGVGAEEDVTATAGIFASKLSEPRILDALAGRRAGATKASATLAIRAYHPRTIALSTAGLAPGSYVQAVYLRAAMNPQRTFLAVGDPFTVTG